MEPTPIGHWRLAGDAEDASGNGNQGQMVVGTWPEASVFRWERDGVWTNTGRLGEELEVMGMAVYNGKLYAGTELIEKLAALIPPPRLNLVRYHSILAPNARARSQIVSGPPSCTAATALGAALEPPLRAHRLTWAALLARVFVLDVTVCPDCGGRLRLIAALTEPASIRRYLQGVGCPTEPPPLTPPRAPPQLEWDFAADAAGRAARSDAVSLNTRRYIARCPPLVGRRSPSKSAYAGPSAPKTSPFVHRVSPAGSRPRAKAATPAGKRAIRPPHRLTRSPKRPFIIPIHLESKDDPEKSAALAGRLDEVDAVVVCHGAPRLDAALMDQAPRLKIIGELEGDRFAARIDLDAAWAREFGLLWPGAVFVNVSRGKIVDSQALIERLKKAISPRARGL